MSSSHKKWSSSSSYEKYEVRNRNPNPKSCALLVIDMQNYFSSMGSSILHNLNTTITLCRRASIPVIFTRHRHKSPSDHGMLEEWWFGDLIVDGTEEAQLMTALDRNSEQQQFYFTNLTTFIYKMILITIHRNYNIYFTPSFN